MVWEQIKNEIANSSEQKIAQQILSKLVTEANSLQDSLARVLANKIGTELFPFQELYNIFTETYSSNKPLVQSLKDDIKAILNRDFACEKLSEPLLFYNGFHGLQLQRMAHYFYRKKENILASFLHERMVSVCSMDIHPAVSIGKRVVIDHGIGLVVGETASIGNDVFMYHNVTLGSVGTHPGDRHPKIGNNVLIGSNVTILGNILIGEGSAVAAGSVVTRSVPSQTLVAGNPAKEIGPAKSFQQKN
mmetsp:Transcript_18270/g.29731  ORF Transcript_18270/g.29731 Transcript_18270/m.29731 type:complete len:247 (+) Transcript_18270:333-1073(+)